MPQQELAPFLDKLVSCIANDGKHFVGTLKGFDQNINIILSDAVERSYSTSAGVLETAVGIQMIRGDNVAVVGLLDEELDLVLKERFPELRCPPIKAVQH
eukprot:NODE_2646_length_528_cov_55.643392_g2596_i0.p1 GENE.NODE_2646_length_528_cov_55.643392_g2596_i0~~NODE_2646_length_528_cov_55.643392_g2596_i0.p1  ORF type:complete len:100 (+),score=17.47 NODE_2646_length_528_cov_55.643392_g2596_i0:74-373(+)